MLLAKIKNNRIVSTQSFGTPSDELIDVGEFSNRIGSQPIIGAGVDQENNLFIFDEDYKTFQSGLAASARSPEPEPEAPESYEDLINEQLNNKANQYQYDDLITALSYVNSSNNIFKAEALALQSWRDSVWTWYIGLTESDLMDSDEVNISTDTFINMIPAFTDPVYPGDSDSA